MTPVGDLEATMGIHRIEVSGIPRTKKTSNQGVVVPPKVAGGKPRAVMFPAADWREWVKEAHIVVDGLTLAAVRRSIPRLVPLTGHPVLWTPLAFPMNCRAHIYLGPRQHGDALGYLQGLADLLQARQVIHNDRFLATWNGSRLVHDGSTPRCDVVLEALPLVLE